jgi:hypothetical protein
MIRIVIVVLMLAYASGCANRHLAPECKGPYTRVNQPAVANADGTQSRH